MAFASGAARRTAPPGASLTNVSTACTSALRVNDFVRAVSSQLRVTSTR